MSRGPALHRMSRAAASGQCGTPFLPGHGGWTLEQAFCGSLDQVACVRAAVRLVLEGCPVADDVVLMLSEVAANAVAHSDSGKQGGKFTVRLKHSPGHCVWGEVEDEGSSWDGNLAGSARDRSGLFLVLALSSACGVTGGTGDSLVVWFFKQYAEDCAGEAGG